MALAEEIGRAVKVLDSTGSVLASSDGPLGPPSELATVMPATGGADGFELRREGSWYLAGLGDEGQLVGWLMVDGSTGELEESQAIYVEATSAILGLGLASRKLATSADLLPERDLALAILHGGASPVARLLADRLGYDLGREHVVAAISGLEKVSNPVMLVQQATRQVGAGTPLVARPRERLFVLSAEPVSWDLLCPALQRLGGVSVSIGVSTAHAIGEISEAINEALFALEFGQPGRSGPVTRVSDLGVWQLVLESCSTERLQRFVKDWIGPLLEYDRHHQTELVKTLRTFLWESCNAEATAAALYVHRNTLRYRLSRCEQLLGLDLADQDNRFQLSMACGAQEVLPARQRLDAALREITTEAAGPLSSSSWHELSLVEHRSKVGPA